MSLINVDGEKCTGDGLCTQECPMKILAMSEMDAKKTPVAAAKAEELCIKCGHCVAVCPHGALTLEGQSLDEAPLFKSESLPGAEQIKDFLSSRRSIRRYKKKPVDHELLKEIMDLVRYAPTGGNRQQVYWTVYEDQNKIKDLAGLGIEWVRLMMDKIPDPYMADRFKQLIVAWEKGEDRILHGAPNLILAHSGSEYGSSATDCVIALTYLELYAYSKGLGTCWAGFLTMAANSYAPLTKALDLPPGHQCFGAVMIGYPQSQYHRIPKRNAALLSWR